VRDLVRIARAELGGIDVLMNNAAVSVYGETDRTSPSDHRETMEVNFHGPVRLVLEVLPGLLEQGSGRILNVLSVAALHGLPYLAAYGASKAALAAFGQSLRAELAGTGVLVQNVYPDYIDTPLFAKERRVGSALRPSHGYAPSRRVAEAVVRALEEGREEAVLTVRGRLLRSIGGVYPGLVDRALARMARRLRASEVNDHETAKTPHHRPLSEPR
jgi:short-subunit dehydrogenase